MILEFPMCPGFTTFSIQAENVVASSESGFTKQVQVYDWGGKRWVVTAALPVMNRENAREWEAFFLALNGRAGTFYLYDSLVMEKRGAAKGAPVVDSISGKSLTVSGFAKNVVGQVEPGDWLQIGDRLYKATTRGSSDALGVCSFDVWPSVPSDVAMGTAIDLNAPRGEFRLTEIPELTYRVDGLLAGFEFVAASEV